MNEKKVIKRAWVKKAIIIFLVIMLVLTLFSNTIMNHSLPEVAAQYAESGTITAKIRGTGTVTANETFSVQADAGHTVQSVAVHVGDRVEVGDTLLTLSAGEGDELSTLQEELANAQLDYQRALINAADPDYARENREIQSARSALTRAQAELKLHPAVSTAQIQAAQNKISTAQSAYNKAEAALEEAGGYDPETGLNADKYDAAVSAKAAWDDAAAALDTLMQQKQDYDAAAQDVIDKENTLSDLLFALQQQQKEDNKQSQLTALDLRSQQENIARLEARIDALTTNSDSSTILAETYGVVKTINVTAGDSTDGFTSLIDIEVVDRGYSTTFTVTAEQAKRVSVGDAAEVSNNWWGSGSITAVLDGIRNDPENPNQNKILHFSLSGEDIESGTQLSLTVGGRSASYDTIVPKSAVHSDNKGDFVYIIVAKPSPLGNRYIATRVDVKVLAQDDTMAAISGGVVAYDYVITTSNRPIEAGMQVRMAENG